MSDSAASARTRLAPTAALALIFVSGFAGLIYQLLSVKLAVLVFGATVDAVSTVVAAFVAGLALGSVWGGRLADRTGRPLLMYGLLEGLVGTVCIGLPFFFHLVGTGYGALVHLVSGSLVWVTTLRVVLAGLVVFCPSFLMGASFPLLARHCIRDPGAAGAVFSKLYGANTLGAAAGICAASYWLFPTFGLRWTLALAVCLNLTVAAAAGGYSFFVGARDGHRAPTPPGQAQTTADRPSTVPRDLLLVAFLSGYLVFSMEVIWTHLFQVTVGGSVYVVGAILFAVLAGLGLGSVLLARAYRHLRDPRALLCALLGLSGLAIAAHIPLWNRIPAVFVALGPLDLGFTAREIVRFLVVTGAVLIPCALLGAVFPLCTALALRDLDVVGRNIGRLYAVNSAGSIAGPLLAGFLLLPRLGSLHTLRLHALAYVLMGGLMTWTIRRALPRGQLAGLLVLAAGGIATVAAVRSWDPRPLTSGANVYFSRGFTDYDRLVHLAESVPGGITTVIEKGKERTLLSNGKFQGTSGGETFFQVNQALVPMVFLRRYGRALNIGLGTGHTLATMAVAPFEGIDVAEIAPDIVDAADRFFSELNRGVLHDPRVHVYEVDGRNFLLLHPEARYDLITIQLNSIWLAGAASLYNEEFYEICRKRLASGGVLQQWLQLHHMRWEDQLAVIATLAKVFPHVSLWQFDHQAILLASDQPLVGDYRRALALERRFAAVGQLGGFPTGRLFSVLAYHRLDDRNLRALLTDSIAPHERSRYLSTDMRPRLEYGTPRGVALPNSARAFRRLTAAYSFTPLRNLLSGIPEGEETALADLLERERNAATP